MINQAQPHRFEAVVGRHAHLAEADLSKMSRKEITMDMLPFPVSPVVCKLFTADGIDALSECIRTVHAVAERLGLSHPSYWTYDPSDGGLSSLRTTLADDDRTVLEIPLPIRFACITHDGPQVDTPPAHCRLFLHQGTIWTAAELLDQGVRNVQRLAATRRWLHHLAEGQARDSLGEN